MKLSDTRIATVLESLRIGCSRRVAAASAGISDDTLRRWAARSPSLRLEIEKAEAQATMAAVESVRRASLGGDWRASAWWLERRNPEEWGLRRQVERASEALDVRVSFATECGECGGPTRARANDGTPA